MVKKRIFLSLVLLCVVSIPSLTAWSDAHERIWMRNELDEPIGVYCDFQHEGVDFLEYWNQFVDGIDVWCISSCLDGELEKYRGNAEIQIVEYKPARNAMYLEDLTYLKEIPLEQKLKELFKTLVITDAEGQVLLTLDDFSKARVEVGPNGRTYDIIIGEYLYQ